MTNEALSLDTDDIKPYYPRYVRITPTTQNRTIRGYIQIVFDKYGAAVGYERPKIVLSEGGIKIIPNK